MPRTIEISVVIPVFNKSSFIEESIGSALNQSFEDIEIICIDDCSTDDSLKKLELLKSKDSRLKVFRMSSNQGAGRARNFGISLASGRHVAFLDADDFYTESALEQLKNLAEKTKSPLVRGSMISRHESGREIQSEWQKMPERNKTSMLEEPALWFPWGFTCYLYSRQFLIKKNCTFPDLSPGEDSVFLANCLSNATDISLTSNIVYVYNIAGTEHSSRKTFFHALDFVEKARMIKELYYSAGQSTCWLNGCGPYYRQEIQEWINAKISNPNERRLLVSKVASVWSDELNVEKLDEG